MSAVDIVMNTFGSTIRWKTVHYSCDKKFFARKISKKWTHFIERCIELITSIATSMLTRLIVPGHPSAITYWAQVQSLKLDFEFHCWFDRFRSVFCVPWIKARTVKIPLWILGTYQEIVLKWKTPCVSKSKSRIQTLRNK